MRILGRGGSGQREEPVQSPRVWATPLGSRLGGDRKHEEPVGWPQEPHGFGLILNETGRYCGVASRGLV